MSRLLFEAHGLPALQNRVYATREQATACTVGDVRLVQDEVTGLVFNEAFDPALLTYDEDYQNEQAHSPTFQRHLDEVMALLLPHMGHTSVLEVGCGKGYFLDRMRARGWNAVGVDPAYEGASAHVVKAAFDASLGLSGEGIVLRHVLEHIRNPLDFLASIARANGGKGLIYIEVPCLDWIAGNRAWFDIFYEHVNYFRLRDLQAMFSNVLASGRLFGGQYIYLIADLSTLRAPPPERVAPFEMPADFLDGVTACREQAAAHQGSRAAWGGSSKGVIFCSYLARQGQLLDAVIDINTAKQGRFVAVTGIPIVSPETALQLLEPGALVFVMNPNYFDEIVAQSRSRFHYARV
ncbi:MAG: class I SAM-dependent methyltransferase [Pseudomonadota bacterium]